MSDDVTVIVVVLSAASSDKMSDACLISIIARLSSGKTSQSDCVFKVSITIIE